MGRGDVETIVRSFPQAMSFSSACIRKSDGQPVYNCEALAGLGRRERGLGRADELAFGCLELLLHLLLHALPRHRFLVLVFLSVPFAPCTVQHPNQLLAVPRAAWPGARRRFERLIEGYKTCASRDQENENGTPCDATNSAQPFGS